MLANVTTWESERAPTVIDVDERTITAVHVPPHGRAGDDLDSIAD